MLHMIVVNHLIRTVICFCILHFLHCHSLSAQVNVGEPFPDLQVNTVTPIKKSVKLSEFTPKWKMITFWSAGCRSAIKLFPELSRIQNEFGDELQLLFFLRSGSHQYRHNLKAFEYLNRKFPSNSVAALDSSLYKQMGLPYVPHVFIVDPAGILRVVTDGRNLSVENVKLLLFSKPVSFTVPLSLPTKSLNDGIDGKIMSAATLSTSTLRLWNGENIRVGPDMDTYFNLPDEIVEEGWRSVGTTLISLYMIAYVGRDYWFPEDSLYWGKYFPHPVIEARDQSPFSVDQDKGKGLYDYYFKSSADALSKELLQSSLKKELRSAFQFDAAVEFRSMPVWKLVIADTEKAKGLQSRNKSFYESDDLLITGKTYRTTMAHHIFVAALYTPIEDQWPIIDETNIKGLINFTLKEPILDLDDLKKHFQEYGLKLIPDHMMLNTLVIRDKVQ